MKKRIAGGWHLRRFEHLCEGNRQDRSRSSSSGKEDSACFTNSAPAPNGQSDRTVPEAWAARAVELADWAMRLRNRTDIHGRYLASDRRKVDPSTGRVLNAYTCHAELTHGLLVRHFAGAGLCELAGLHTTSLDETCRWIVVDFDAHGDGDDPAGNLAMATDVFGSVRCHGFDALLLDSNGAGGYHLWVLFGGPIPSEDAWRLGRWLVRDHARFGLVAPPESFPKQPRLRGKRIGNWVRLPGRHHTKDHWTKVRCPRRGDWLARDEAIGAILRVRGRDVPISAVVPPGFGVVPELVRASKRRLPVLTRSRDAILAEDALKHLGPKHYDDYDNWLRVGMCLSQLGDVGLARWHAWSERSAKYEPAALDEKWGGFAPGEGLTLGSLFKWAEDAGWEGLQHLPSAHDSRRRGTRTIRVPRRAGGA